MVCFPFEQTKSDTNHGHNKGSAFFPQLSSFSNVNINTDVENNTSNYEEDEKCYGGNVT